MPITTISMALNVAIGFTVWMSDLPLAAKIILTVILAGKTVLFFCTSWMGESEKIRKAGSVALIVLNLAVILYSLICEEYFVVFTTAVALVAFGIWSFAVVFDFTFGKKDDK